MELKFESIIKKGQADGKSYEEINAELKAAGANFHLNPNGRVSGWTEQEIAEGFRPGVEAVEVASDGRPIRFSTKAPGGGTYAIAVPVMDRDVARANSIITVGHWELSYDSLGYCYSRKNLRK